MKIIQIVVALSYMIIGCYGQSSDYKEVFLQLKNEHHYEAEKPVLIISEKNQELYYYVEGELIKTYTISTAEKGIGNKAGSYMTPAGVHCVKEKYGDGAEEGTIFESRLNTGRRAVIYKEPINVEKDEVTTRILWLEGKEDGVNKGEGIDSYKRYIYIHGTPEEGLLGVPASKGCIRMRNSDVISLYDMTPIGSFVVILKDC